MASDLCKKPHAIMIALPYQGHITPYVNLAIKLASNSFSITFVHLEFIHHKLSLAQTSDTKNESDIFSDARESGLDIRYTTISDGYPLEFDRHSEDYWHSMLRDFPGRVDDFVGRIIQSDQDSVHFLVTDTMWTWASTIARKYNLVSVSFWTEPALVFSLCYHVDLLKQNGHFPCADNIEENINYIPGVESISTKDLMPYLKASGVATIEHKVTIKAFEEVKKADFILHNTVHELESNTISALTNGQPNYAVGPINFSRNIGPNTVSKSLWSESDCSSWLNTKPQNTVLYISFGSFVRTKMTVFQEIAHALLTSDVNFIWVVRADSVDSEDFDCLPDGFRDGTKDRGLIVTWCDQIMVLSHTAVGGFLTHCGWNSILESMWCGVPMVCYPLQYDQLANRKLVVDDWRIGINLCDGTVISRNDIVEKIESLMSETISEELRQETKKAMDKLHDALENDGSSENNCNQFIEDLKTKLMLKARN